jgi:hypothetical protein
LESIPFYKYAGEYEQITPLVGRFLYAAAASTPGTWSGPTDITAVPEPTPLTILSAGIAALWLAIRRYPRRLGSQGG